MSMFVQGDLAKYRAVLRDGVQGWLWECPGCGVWGNLDNDQWLGTVSVDHAADGCPGRYHETHNFAADLEAHIDEQTTDAATPAPEEAPKLEPRSQKGSF